MGINYQVANCINRHFLALLCFLIFIQCGESNVEHTAAGKYISIQPVYKNIQLLPQNDTFHFLLDDNTYNDIKCSNSFTDKNEDYFSFFDGGSKSVNIYSLRTQKQQSKIFLEKRIRNTNLAKASVYVQNFDSIFITTSGGLYLLDSAGTIKNEMDFSKEIDKKAFIDNTVPIFLKDNIAYVGLKPFIREKSLSIQQNWKLVYGFDLKNKTKKVYYSLPGIYQKHLFGYYFLEYSYCVNDKGNFVFSFPADTNIYETNLTDYHQIYYGKSRFQSGPILPVTENEIEKEGSYKLYAMRDSYGPIFYDAYTQRYIRQAKQKISESDYSDKKRSKKKSIIIFNKNFQIIGESETDDSFVFSSVFFASDGSMYARTKVNDEQALHFVRLDYNQMADEVKLAATELSN